MNSIEYGLSFEDYKKAAGVNASFLSAFKRSPAHGMAYIQESRAESKAFQMGTLAHKFTLEPDIAAHGIITKPDGIDFRTTAGKAWRDQNADKTIITPEEKKDLIGIVNSVLTHPVASPLFTAGQSEVSMFAPYGPVLRKGRVDFLPKGNAIVDLKTCADASPQSFSRDVVKWDYHMKAAYYLDIANALGLEREVFILVCVEKTLPYAVKVYQMHTEAISKGREMYQELLSKYAECQLTDNWPSYPEDIEILNLPSWALNKAA